VKDLAQAVFAKYPLHEFIPDDDVPWYIQNEILRRSAPQNDIKV
jgi:hypothetical protein